MLILFFFCATTLIIFFYCWKKLDLEIKISFAVYGIAYLITTLIGGTFIGLTNNNFAMNILHSYGIETSLLTGVFDLGFWALLYSPLLIPLLIIIFLNKHHRESYLNRRYLHQPIDFPSFWFVYIFLLMYFGIKILTEVSLKSLENLITNPDYRTSIQLRYQLVEQLGSNFYGLAYTTMPVFSHIALFQWLKTRTTSWKLTFFISLLVTCMLYLIIVLKGVLLLYLISIALGFYVLKAIRLSRVTLWMGGLVLLIITSYQYFITPDWRILDSIYLILFRLASSFPFYYALYPKILSYTGIYLGIPIFNFGAAPHDNQVVWSYMYPGTDWIIGAVTGPSPLLAYSQAGFIFAYFTMVLIGLFILLIAYIGRQLRGPLQYALYMQGLVFLYYLTQISIQSAFMSSYGILWGLLGIGILFIVSLIFRSALRH